MEGHAGHAHPHSPLGEMDDAHPFLGEGEVPPPLLACSLIHLPTHSPLPSPGWLGRWAALVILCPEEDEEGDRFEVEGASPALPVHHRAR